MNHVNIEGLIPILGGVYMMLVASGVLPKSPKDPEKDDWRQKYGLIVKILGSIVILFGILQLVGIH